MSKSGGPGRESTARQFREADVPTIVDTILAEARGVGASDLHLQPTPEGLVQRRRVDGVLRALEPLPAALAPNIVARLKVLANLLTYRNDLPQEGRIRAGAGGAELRVSTFPTIHGEKAVVRFFADPGRFARLGDLGFPAEVASGLAAILEETSGALLLAGPAGAGKSTTFYACLRELAESSGGRRNLSTLEDPVEVAIPGVAQSQIQPNAGFTLGVGLRALMRQDPEVIGVGEIRDAEVAESVVDAALTGHLVLSTFHAGSAAEVLGRLLDLGIEPYAIRGGVRAVVSQQLLRRLCDLCARPSTSEADLLGLPIESARIAVGCPACGASGYDGRFAVAELLRPELGGLPALLRNRPDVPAIEAAAIESGMVPIRAHALTAVLQGRTDPAEVRRIFGTRTFGLAAPTIP